MHTTRIIHSAHSKVAGKKLLDYSFYALVSFQIPTLFFLLPKRAFQDYRNKQKDRFDIKSRVKYISLKMSEVKSENKYIKINVAHYCSDPRVQKHVFIPLTTHFCSLTDTTRDTIFIIAGAPLQVGFFISKTLFSLVRCAFNLNHSR